MGLIAHLVSSLIILSSGGRKFANLCWQIGSRLARGPIVTQFANSALLLAVPGMADATGTVYVGLREFVDMSFVLHFLRPNHLLIDVGATIGSYTKVAAPQWGLIAFPSNQPRKPANC